MRFHIKWKPGFNRPWFGDEGGPQWALPNATTCIQCSGYELYIPGNIWGAKGDMVPAWLLCQPLDCPGFQCGRGTNKESSRSVRSISCWSIQLHFRSHWRWCNWQMGVCGEASGLHLSKSIQLRIWRRKVVNWKVWSTRASLQLRRPAY